MRCKCYKSQIKHLLFQDEIIAYKIQKNINYKIATTTGCIPEHLNGHELPEKRIKEVDETEYKCPDLIMNSPHNPTKIRDATDSPYTISLKHKISRLNFSAALCLNCAKFRR